MTPRSRPREELEAGAAEVGRVFGAPTRRRRAQGRALRRCRGAVRAAAPAVRRSDRRRRDGPRTDRATRPSTSCSSTAAASRRRSADLHRDLRLPRRRGARLRDQSRARAAVDQHRPRRRRRPRQRAASTCRRRISRRFGVTEDDLRAGVVTEPVRAPAARSSSSAPASTSTRPRRRCRGPMRAAWSPPRSWAPSTRDPAPHRAARLRRVHGGDSRADAGRALIAADDLGDARRLSAIGMRLAFSAARDP